MTSVAIAGVGLIGGSFALALREAGFRGPIAGIGTPESLQEALSLKVVDDTVSLSEAAASFDLIYLALPIRGIIDAIRQIAPVLREGTLVTDAGSTKVEIVAEASRLLPNDSFLGGHPMAGKESSGVKNASADLFRGKTYVLTSDWKKNGLTPIAGAYVTWLESVGAVTVFMSPEYHDETVALTSHLPQLISTSLAAFLNEQDLTDERLAVSGSGLRDMTRLAASNYDIWEDILSSNTVPIVHALDVYIDKLTRLRHHMHTRQLKADFRMAAETALRLRRLGART